MRLASVAPAVLAAVISLSGCAHPYLKAGAGLAETTNQGDSALSALADTEVRTYRIYTFVEPAAEKFNKTDPDGDFVTAACHAHAVTLVNARGAILNLDSYQKWLGITANDPKKSDLLSLIRSLGSVDMSFAASNQTNLVDAYMKKQTAAMTECLKDVPEVFKANAHAGAAVGALVISAWPKIKDALTVIATEANKMKREDAIIDSLKDAKTRDVIRSSLDALCKETSYPGSSSCGTSQNSRSWGSLALLSREQKQIALWSAYVDFQEMKKVAKSGNDQFKNYGMISENAEHMTSYLEVYDQLSSVDLPQVVSKMRDAYEKLWSDIDKGTPPDDSAIAELVASVEFLSDAANKYNAAASALSGKSSKKT